MFPPKPGGLALQSKILADFLTEEGLPVVSINVHVERGTKTLFDKVYRAVVQPLRLFYLLVKHSTKVRRIHVAVCSYWGFMPLVASLPVAKARRVQLSITYHGGKAAPFMKKHHHWAAPLLKRVDAVVVPSFYLRDIFLEYGIETMVLPVIGIFSRENSVNRKKLAPILVSTRHLEPLYDVATVLRAFRSVQDVFPAAQLIIAGNGSQKQQLEEFVSRNKLNVAFRGEVPFEEIPELLSEADIFVNPATADNMPMSVLEAMYYGLLVITTPVGELPYLLTHGEQGLFYLPKDTDSLSNTILYALAHRKRSLTCARNARRIAERCTWDHLREGYLSLFHQ